MNDGRIAYRFAYCKAYAHLLTVDP